MTGISNRPEPEEEANQQRVAERKGDLPPADQAGRKGRPAYKLRDDLPEDRDRISETGAGRGPDHQGH